jgi:hypothetical protein
MEKIAFVKLCHDKAGHWIPATAIKRETGSLVIYHGEQVVGKFDLVRVEHWALELAATEAEALAVS